MSLISFAKQILESEVNFYVKNSEIKVQMKNKTTKDQI